MMRQLFPKEFINSSLEHYTFKIRKRNSGIYILILCAVIVSLLSLPLIHVDVVTTIVGSIDTKTQRHTITSPSTGRVSGNEMVENRFVRKGQLLLLIDKSDLESELRQISNKLTELNQFLADLQQLLSEKEALAPTSSKYKIELLQYESRLDQLNLEKEALEIIYKRQKKLLDQHVIAQVEFDRDEANYQRVVAEIELFKKQSLSNWKEASLRFHEEKKSLQLRHKKLHNECEKHSVLAPVSGELQNVSPIAVGQVIQAGQQLAQLTPDTTLMAILWVPPHKIGLIRPGLKGYIKVDAYNYNDWGFLEAKIEEVSSDAYLLKDQPFFKVICSINKPYLQLRNGFIGQLKKGMTVSGNFNVANRSLYQLLYDKVDNWLNPKTR